MGASCVSCGKSLQGRRSDARFCSDACRMRLNRNPPVDRSAPGIPVDLRGAAVKPSEKDIARLIMSTQSIQAGFRLASERSEKRFRPICSRIADGLEDILRREGL